MYDLSFRACRYFGTQPSKIAERRELYLSRMRGMCVDVVRPKLSGVPIPKTPTSEDYSQFSEIMSNDFTPRTILMVFKEMFHTDSEDRIIRITDRLSDPNLHSAIDGEYRSFIDDTFRTVSRSDVTTKYYRIQHWLDACLREIRGSRDSRGGGRKRLYTLFGVRYT